MLNINENTNINGNITVTDGGAEKQVMSINTNLSKEGINFNLNFNVVDKEALTANKADIQTQVDSFMSSVRTKMTELGYLFTI